jgi:hypothetical protein
VGSRAVSLPRNVVSLCFLGSVKRAEMLSLGPSLVEGEVSQSPRVAVLPGPGAPLSVTGEGAAGKGRDGGVLSRLTLGDVGLLANLLSFSVVRSKSSSRRSP